MSDLQRIKKALEGAVNKRKQAELNSRSEEIMTTIGQDLVSALTPILKEMAGQAGGNNESLVREITSAVTQAMREIKIEMPSIEVPETAMDFEPILDAIRSIKIEVPQSAVNVPAPIVNIPETKFPEFPKFPEEVGLRGVDRTKPLPVLLMDGNGKQFQFPMGASGGKGDFFTIKGFNTSAFAELQNADGRLKVSVETGGSGLTDSELRATAVPVSQVSGSSWSVNVETIFGSTITSLLNGDNRLPVSVETGGSGLTDSELRASSVPVAQASGAIWSTAVKEIFGSTITALLNGDNRIPVSIETGGSGLTDSELRASAVPVSQVSGASWSVEATISGTPTVQATDLDIRDLLNASDSISAYQVSGANWSVEVTNTVPVSQSGTWNIGTVTTVTGITNSIASANVDSTGVQYSGSNPMPVYLAATSGATNSTISVGDLASDAVDTGSAPVKIGGIARTANPTAVAAGDRVSATFDDLGRQMIRPVQVRDLTVTAYATLTNGTETTLLAASAGSYHDLIYVMGANASDVAVTVDLRAVTAGNKMLTLQIPANGTAGVSLPVPIPQDATGNNWTADMGDITGTTVYLSALFSREV